MLGHGDRHGRSGREARRPSAASHRIGAQHEPGDENDGQKRRREDLHGDGEPAPRAGVVMARRAGARILAVGRAYWFLAAVKGRAHAAPRQSRNVISVTIRNSCFSSPQRAMASSEARLACRFPGPRSASQGCSATATDTGVPGERPVDPRPPPIGSALSMSPAMRTTAKHEEQWGEDGGGQRRRYLSATQGQLRCLEGTICWRRPLSAQEGSSRQEPPPAPSMQSTSGTSCPEAPATRSSAPPRAGGRSRSAARPRRAGPAPGRGPWQACAPLYRPAALARDAFHLSLAA